MILGYIGFQDVGEVRRVCRRWLRIYENEVMLDGIMRRCLCGMWNMMEIGEARTLCNATREYRAMVSNFGRAKISWIILDRAVTMSKRGRSEYWLFGQKLVTGKTGVEHWEEVSRQWSEVSREDRQKITVQIKVENALRKWRADRKGETVDWHPWRQAVSNIEYFNPQLVGGVFYPR